MAQEKIGVLIVDDSALVRMALHDILRSDTRFEVLGAVSDPFAAAKKMQRQKPDVILLDIKMPRMDGITFLQKIMKQHPIPVVICSSYTDEGADLTLQALQHGAVDIISKPKIAVRGFLEDSRNHICDTVQAAALLRHDGKSSFRKQISPRLSSDEVIPLPESFPTVPATERIAVVGASTGGTEAIRKLVIDLPSGCPGMVVVQHMPAQFTAAFARRLNAETLVSVKEASDGDNVLPGQVLISPGDSHILLRRSGLRYCVEMNDGPPINRHRPSVDVLFRSAALAAGQNGIGIILTGMGDDGARGLKEMKEAGATTIAQDETSCIVFGMPKEAIARGGVDHVLPLERIALRVMKFAGKGR